MTAVNRAVAALADDRRLRARSSAAPPAGCASAPTGCCARSKGTYRHRADRPGISRRPPIRAVDRRPRPGQQYAMYALARWSCFLGDKPRPHPLADRRPAGPGRLHPVRGARAQPARGGRRRHPTQAFGKKSATGSRRTRCGSPARPRHPPGLLLRLRLLLHRSDQRRRLRTEVESVEGQHLLDRSFPSGATALTDIVVKEPDKVQSGAGNQVAGVERSRHRLPARRRRTSPAPWSRRRSESKPYSTEAFDLGRTDPLTRPKKRLPGTLARRADGDRIRRPRRGRPGTRS